MSESSFRLPVGAWSVLHIRRNPHVFGVDSVAACHVQVALSFLCCIPIIRQSLDPSTGTQIPRDRVRFQKLASLVNVRDNIQHPATSDNILGRSSMLTNAPNALANAPQARNVDSLLRAGANPCKGSFVEQAVLLYAPTKPTGTASQPCIGRLHIR